MIRYRPPQPRSTPYITPSGFQRLQEELKTLWVRRAEVTKALSAAAAGRATLSHADAASARDMIVLIIGFVIASLYAGARRPLRRRPA